MPFSVFAGDWTPALATEGIIKRVGLSEQIKRGHFDPFSAE
jgi:hypothetical protein